jgi:hypothetical protein
MARKLELELQAKSNADVVFNRIQKASENFGSDLAKRFTSAFGAMALVDRGLAMVQQGFDFVVSSVKKYADIADKAQKSGMDGEDFQRLAAAAEEAGVSMQTVSKAARELRILMKDAASGNQLAIDKLKALGFTEEQVKSGTIKATDVFLQLANAMEQAGSDADKLAIMTAIFGDKVATDLLPLLDQTRAKLRQTFGETPIMNNQALKDLDNMMDKLGKLKLILEFIAATAAYQTIFGRGSLGRAVPGAADQLIPIPGIGGVITGIQAAAGGAVGDGKPNGTDTGPSANSSALAALGTKIGEASMGSGVIGVGASPQVAAIQESNTLLASIDSKMGDLVKGSIDTDFTKSVRRKVHAMDNR